MSKHRRLVVFVVLLNVLAPLSVGTVVAADKGTISNVVVTEEFDRDGDGKYSKFTLWVTADTRTGGVLDPADPYFKIFVNGQLVRTSHVEATQYGGFEFTISRSKLSDISAGHIIVTVELWDQDAVFDNRKDEYNFYPDGEFEPPRKDYTVEQRALIGINKFEDPYDSAGNQLDVSYLQQEQIDFVNNAFEALIPTTQRDAQYDTAMTLLSKAASVSMGWIENLLAIPAVAANVGSSLHAGTQANTLTKTDSGTRHDFHLYLDNLQQNTERISTNPDEVRDQQLEKRLEYIRKVYQHSRQYESEVHNTYTDNQQYFPDWMIALYGADEESLKQVEGEFTQLNQNLIADYYYTQLALNPNQQPTNLTTVVGYEQPSYPEAEITSIDIPETVTAGEPTTVAVTVRTEHDRTPSQTVTVGFPDADKVKNIEISGHNLNNPSYTKVFDAGSELWSDYGDRQRTITYPVAEVADQMAAGSTHSVEFTFTPTETGQVRLWVKSIAWTAPGASGSLVPDPRGDGANVVTDGQDELAYERTVHVEPRNNPPDAHGMSVSTKEGSSVSKQFDASDPDGDSLSYTITSAPDHGSVSTSGDSFTYTPAGDYAGSDSFTYQVKDGNGGTDSATVSVSVTPTNDPPTANSVSVSTTEGSAVTDSFDASDPDNDPLMYTITSAPDHGSVSTSGDTFTYTPSADYAGSDSFTYRVKDGNGGTDTATVSVSVQATNEPPNADRMRISTKEGAVVSEGFDASDPDDDPLEYTVIHSPDHGSVSISGNSFTYAPATEYSGSDSFTYRVNDGNGGTDTATVSISVRATNDPPTADRVRVSTAEGSAVSETFEATDPDGDSLVYRIVSSPDHGSVSKSGDSFTYTPVGDYTGKDSFTYRVTDGDGGTDTATVTVTVAESTLPLDKAIDMDGNGRISDAEIREAIRLWRTNSVVPDTNEETISDREILRLIEMWRNGTEV